MTFFPSSPKWVPAATLALAWSCLQVAVDGISMDFLVYPYHVHDLPNHAFIFPSSLGRPGSTRFLFFSPFFVPVLSLCFPLPFFFFSFNFCFPFFFSLSGWVVLVVSCGWYFGFSAALSCVGASTRPVFFVLFCCVISLCLGFGSPRVFCPVLLPRRSWCHAGRKVGILLAARI